MALRNQPYIPLYVQDYLTDEKLNACSSASQGIYIKIMCVLHKSDPYGTILLKQKDKQNSSTIKDFACKFAKLLPFKDSEIESALTELIDEGVMTLDGDILFQKRMVRDNELSNKRACAGSKGGKSRIQDGDLLKQKDKQNQSKTPSKIQATSENEYEYENEVVTKTTKKDINIFFEELWKLYPLKKGKAKIKDSQKEKLFYIGIDELARAIKRYDGEVTDKTYLQHGSTFFNGGYIDYIDANYQEKPKPSAKPNANPFKDKLKELMQDEQDRSNGGNVGYQGGLSKLLQKPDGD